MQIQMRLPDDFPSGRHFLRFSVSGAVWKGLWLRLLIDGDFKVLRTLVQCHGDRQLRAGTVKVYLDRLARAVVAQRRQKAVFFPPRARMISPDWIPAFSEQLPITTLSTRGPTGRP